MIELCQIVGKRVPIWTQGLGGNISYKDGSILWVKASGYRLDAVSSNIGLAQVNIDRFKDWFFRQEVNEESYSQGIEQSTLPLKNGDFLRPSMETGFHVVLKSTYVIHFHSVIALLMAHEYRLNCSRVSDWFAENGFGSQVEWLDSIRPGLLLAKEIHRRSNASVWILRNHGILLATENPDLLERWQNFEAQFAFSFGYAEMAELCMSHQPLILAKSLVKDVKLETVKLYFPDTAVFLLELSEALDGKRPWTENLREIWLATLLLYKSCPELEELPLSITSSVRGLPTEKYRLKSGDL